MRYFIFALFFVFSTAISAQNCHIMVQLDGYEFDTIWLGHTYGKRRVKDIAIPKHTDGKFYIQADFEYNTGLFAVVYNTKRGDSYLPLWLAPSQQQFSLHTNMAQPINAAKITGSTENELIYKYFNSYDILEKSLHTQTDRYNVLRDEPSYRAMAQSQEQLHQFQANFIQEHQGTLTAKLVAQTQFLLPPKTELVDENWETEASARFQWLKTHYFDNMDLGGGNFLVYPLWVDKTDYYFAKLPPNEPQVMIEMVEKVWQQLAPDRLAYEYYFLYIMNSLSGMGRFRTDEVFVHFVKKYIETGQANFLNENKIQQYKHDAKKMEPLFVGKKAPDITLYDKAQQPIALSSIESPYTLVVFWLYDCGHCQKELPIIQSLYHRFSSKGLKVMSVCGKYGDEHTQKCFQFAEETGMPADWYVVNDPASRSRFSVLYDIATYPRFFILDAKKNIIFKKIGSAPADLLEREFERILVE